MPLGDVSNMVLHVPESLEVLSLGGCEGITGRLPRAKRKAEGTAVPSHGARACFRVLTHRAPLLLLLPAGDVSKMLLPASMRRLYLSFTQVTGECEEDPHPRVPVMRKKVQTRRNRYVPFCNS